MGTMSRRPSRVNAASCGATSIFTWQICRSVAASNSVTPGKPLLTTAITTGVGAGRIAAQAGSTSKANSADARHDGFDPPTAFP